MARENRNTEKAEDRWTSSQGPWANAWCATSKNEVGDRPTAIPDGHAKRNEETSDLEDVDPKR
ncbi:MAG: hypothetical protein P1P76_10650 [Anaerolineales bacterium]|nr:hypothetical protein [Anaerolineales bacterium]